jgi:hypothetical protein
VTNPATNRSPNNRPKVVPPAVSGTFGGDHQSVATFRKMGFTTALDSEILKNGA